MANSFFSPTTRDVVCDFKIRDNFLFGNLGGTGYSPSRLLHRARNVGRQAVVMVAVAVVVVMGGTGGNAGGVITQVVAMMVG